MEVNSVTGFIKYYEQTRKVTNRVVDVIPADKLDWAYMPGKFSLGDIIRHIAGIERHLFMEVIRGNRSAYSGCSKELADGYQNTLGYYHELHRQSMEILNSLGDADLVRKVKTLDGKETTAGNFLRALIVHEVHHRAALCIYLNMLHIVTPPVIGLTERQVIELSK